MKCNSLSFKCRVEFSLLRWIVCTDEDFFFQYTLFNIFSIMFSLFCLLKWTQMLQFFTLHNDASENCETIFFPYSVAFFNSLLVLLNYSANSFSFPFLSSIIIMQKSKQKSLVKTLKTTNDVDEQWRDHQFTVSRDKLEWLNLKK